MIDLQEILVTTARGDARTSDRPIISRQVSVCLVLRPLLGLVQRLVRSRNWFHKNTSGTRRASTSHAARKQAGPYSLQARSAPSRYLFSVNMGTEEPGTIVAGSLPSH